MAFSWQQASRARATLLKSLVNQEKPSKAVDTLLCALAQAGVKFPMRGLKLAALPELTLAGADDDKRLLSGWPARALADPPALKGSIKIKAMQIMGNLAMAVHFAMPDLAPLIFLKLLFSRAWLRLLHRAKEKAEGGRGVLAKS